MSQISSVGKILWAVDAWSSDTAPQKKVVDFLRGWSRDRGCAIEPVNILSPDQLNLSPNFFQDRAVDIEKLGRHRLERWMKNIKLPGLLAPTFLVSDKRSLRSAASLLVSYAKETGAEMIALNSHSRKGIKRLVLGSFAETLILSSDIPVFIVRPGVRATGKYKKIFFPTDFSPSSRAAFAEVIALAKRHQGELILFHQMNVLTDLSPLGMSSAYVYEELFENENKTQRANLESMVTEARKQGVKVTAIFQERPGDVPIGILSAAKRANADILAMTSESGAAASVLLGSITRQVVRKAFCPLWVIHPKAEVKSHKEIKSTRPPRKVAAA